MVEPVPLRTITELLLCKPNNSPKVEMTRGPEHVIKALKRIKYKSSRGKVISIHVQIIMPSQNYNLASKILDTKCNHKYAEKRTVYLSSWLLIREIFLKQWAKDRISDSIIGTGDPLTPEAISEGIDIFKVLTLVTLLSTYAPKGDGVTVVPSNIRREGSQETAFNKSRTSIKKTIPSTYSLISNTLDYNSRYTSQYLNILKNHRNLRSLGLKDSRLFFSTSSAISSSLASLHPWYITGFTDAEGSFMVDIVKSSTHRLG